MFSGTMWTPTLRKSRRAAPEHGGQFVGRACPIFASASRRRGCTARCSSTRTLRSGTILASATSHSATSCWRACSCSNARSWSKRPKRSKDIQKFLAVAGTSPTAAVDRLAEFAADITTAFNKLTGQSVFAHLESFGAIAQMIFAEASRALDGSLAVQPRAMLTLDILNPAPPRAFQLATFVERRASRRRGHRRRPAPGQCVGVFPSAVSAQESRESVPIGTTAGCRPHCSARRAGITPSRYATSLHKLVQWQENS